MCAFIFFFSSGPLFYQSTSSRPVTEDNKNDIVKENKVLIIVKNSNVWCFKDFQGPNIYKKNSIRDILSDVLSLQTSWIKWFTEQTCSDSPFYILRVVSPQSTWGRGQLRKQKTDMLKLSVAASNDKWKQTKHANIKHGADKHGNQVVIMKLKVQFDSTNVFW